METMTTINITTTALGRDTTTVVIARPYRPVPVDVGVPPVKERRGVGRHGADVDGRHKMRYLVVCTRTPPPSTGPKAPASCRYSTAAAHATVSSR